MNEEWFLPPEFILFKNSIDSKEIKIESEKFTEFSIYNQLKYKWFEINVYNTKLTEEDSRKPKYEAKKLLFNKLVEGETSFYEYVGSETVKTFLVEKNNGEFLQLINFNVVLPNEQIVLYSTFNRELGAFLNCRNQFSNRINKVKYDKKQLIDLIVDFNTCKNSDYKFFNLNQKKIIISIIPKFGLTYNRLKKENIGRGFSATSSGLGYTIANELEFSLPFNKRKWSFLLDINYSEYNSSIDSAPFNPEGIEVSETSLLLGLGIRHYFLLDDSQLFMTIKYQYPLTFNREVIFSQYPDATDFESKPVMNFGVGIRLFERVYTELGVNLSSEQSGSLDINFKSFNTLLTIGYSIF
ncbi:hypothetical protein [Polaribacter aestuariivivens]|nr:hypothetical protein [Polaribacter aestuariivivens]